MECARFSHGTIPAARLRYIRYSDDLRALSKYTGASDLVYAQKGYSYFIIIIYTNFENSRKSSFHLLRCAPF
jgi:hypothetical protein